MNSLLPGRTIRVTVLSGLLLALRAVFPQDIVWAQESPSAAALAHLQAGQESQHQGELIRAESEYREALGIVLEQLGLAYRSLNELDKAEKAYSAAAGARAESDDALLGLAVIYLRKGEFQKGVESVQTLLKQKPFHPGARHLMGKLYFSMKNYNKAAQELEEAVRLTPNEFSVATTLALTYLKRQEKEKADKIFARLVSELGESPQIHILIGGAYRQTEYLNDAIRELKRAIELNPRYPRAHAFLALAYLTHEGRDKMPDAIKELKTELLRDPNDYLSNYLLGLVYLEKRELEEAAGFMEKASHLEADKPDAHLFLGKALSLLGRHEEAILPLKRAIELTEDPSRNGYQIADGHYLLGQALRRQGKIEEAKEHFAVSSELKAKSQHESEGRLAMYMKGEQEGEEQLGKSVEGMSGVIVVKGEAPTDSERDALEKIREFCLQVAGNAYHQLGLLYAGRSDFRRAAREFDRAAEWYPDIPDLDYNLGLACYRSQQYRRAIAPLERAQASQPDRLPVRILLGLSYFFADDYPHAVQQLSPLADKVGGDPQVMYALGLSLAHTGERPRGEGILRGLLARSPRTPELHLAMGQVLAMNGEFKAAAEEFSKALELNSSLPEAHYYAGLALLRQTNFSAAAEEFRKEIALNPGHVKARYHLGFCLASQQNTEEAVRQMERAIRADPLYAEAYYQLGKLQLQQGHTKEALANLEKAVGLDSGKYYIHYQLSQAYLKSGRREEATAALSRYRDLKARARNVPRDPQLSP